MMDIDYIDVKCRKESFALRLRQNPENFFISTFCVVTELQRKTMYLRICAPRQIPEQPATNGPSLSACRRLESLTIHRTPSRESDQTARISLFWAHMSYGLHVLMLRLQYVIHAGIKILFTCTSCLPVLRKRPCPASRCPAL